MVRAMQIRVASTNTPSDDKRAYAEYRFFIALASYDTSIRSVNVALAEDPAVSGQCQCTVIVELLEAGQVKTQARAVHAIAAIDRAVERTAWLCRRRTRPDFSTL
jgi:hypothetical protein